MLVNIIFKNVACKKWVIALFLELDAALLVQGREQIVIFYQCLQKLLLAILLLHTCGESPSHCVNSAFLSELGMFTSRYIQK